ncbi:MAG: hypothetical protein M3O46_22660 [Myxococcota bacterium]|nr:hypothetical protein [Myxococcota bacterium]
MGTCQMPNAGACPTGALLCASSADCPAGETCNSGRSGSMTCNVPPVDAGAPMVDGGAAVDGGTTTDSVAPVEAGPGG